MISFLYITLLYSLWVDAQLVVNVLNKGGEIIKETIIGNTTLDTIHLDFEKYDGTKVQQFIEFRNNLQIFRIIIPPDQDSLISERITNVLCFITPLLKDSFISPDAMSKLRQKNPSATRTPELVQPVKKNDFDSRIFDVDSDAAAAISEHIPSLCSKSIFEDSNHIQVLTYIRRDIIKELATNNKGKNLNLMESALKQPNLEGKEPPELCSLISENKNCVCIYRLLIGWYPCELKYCRGKDTFGKIVNFRCGIKTCSISHRFNYIGEKKDCITDDL